MNEYHLTVHPIDGFKPTRVEFKSKRKAIKAFMDSANKDNIRSELACNDDGRTLGVWKWENWTV